MINIETSASRHQTRTNTIVRPSHTMRSQTDRHTMALGNGSRRWRWTMGQYRRRWRCIWLADHASTGWPSRPPARGRSRRIALAYGNANSRQFLRPHRRPSENRAYSGPLDGRVHRARSDRKPGCSALTARAMVCQQEGRSTDRAKKSRTRGGRLCRASACTGQTVRPDGPAGPAARAPETRATCRQTGCGRRSRPGSARSRPNW